MKDPAFLFYSNDFLSGTMLMTDEEIGQYIKLLCLQHQKGHLKEKDMLNICKTYNEDIFSKFKKDENGDYYNERLEEETIRRKKYSESRRNNRKKREKETYEEDMKNICNSYEEDTTNTSDTYEEHMETETVTVIINKDNIDFYNNNIGFMTPYELEVLEGYVKEFGNEMFLYAMQLSIKRKKKSVSYIEGIFKNWKKAGIKTVVEAKQENEKRNNVSAEEEFLNAN